MGEAFPVVSGSVQAAPMRDSTVDSSVRTRGVAVLLAIGLAALTVAAFWPALDARLTNWDDDVNITNNPHIVDINVRTLRWMFFSHLQGHYQPLTWLSYAVDYQLWGGTARGYHLSNILLHVATVIGFYVLARQLLVRSLSEAGRLRGTAGWFAAAMAAAVFAVHPLRVESVAWATERRDVLSGACFVLSISLYVRSQASGGVRRALWYVGALAAFAPALLAKVMVVSLPAVLLVLDYFPLRRLHLRAWRVWLEKAPFFLLGFAASAMAVTAQSGASAMLSFEQYGLLPRMRQAVVSFGFYIYRTLAPVNLCTLYELRGPIPWSAPGFLAALGIVAVAAVLLFVGRRRVPAIIAACAAYALILVPVSGLFQNGPQIVADRYSYLSCMGFAVLIGGGWLMSTRRWRRAITGLAGAALVALAALTHELSRSWKDDLSLWTRVVQLDPASCTGRLNLGTALADLGRHEAALALYEGVIEARPDQARTYYAYGNSLLAMGRIDQALRAYRTATGLQPDYADAYNNLGNALLQSGNPGGAEQAYNDALRARPGYAKAHYNYARLLVGQGRVEDALQHLRAAVERAPAFAEARTELAFALAETGAFLDAIAVLEAGTTIAPADPRITGALAMFLATAPDDSLRNGRRAIDLAQRAIDGSERPGPVLFGTLAAGYAEVGRFADAVKTIDVAIEIATDSGDVALLEEFHVQRARYASGLRFRAADGPVPAP